MDKAWMLRQDGAAFPLTVHVYTMQDEDLSSEAEVASFLIASKSKDIGLAEQILDAWLALLIEDTVSYEDDAAGIEECIRQMLNLLPYSFPYPLTEDEYVEIHNRLHNYTDIDEYYEYLDDIRSRLPQLQDAITKSLNQQFCRVRYGGQYDTQANNNTIWFRISSVGFNWANTIYIFASEHKRSLNIQYITICRDYESDNGARDGKPEYFYKAKDGAVYYNMPIEEFLAEEHEHSLVFSGVDLNRGVLATIRQQFADGSTYEEICAGLQVEGITPHVNTWNYLKREDHRACIEASDFLDNAHPRSKVKYAQVRRKIEMKYPEIHVEDIDCYDRANTRGKMVGCEIIYLLSSDIKELHGLEISTAFNRAQNDYSADALVRQFSYEYESYLKFKNIQVDRS